MKPLQPRETSFVKVITGDHQGKYGTLVSINSQRAKISLEGSEECIELPLHCLAEADPVSAGWYPENEECLAIVTLFGNSCTTLQL